MKKYFLLISSILSIWITTFFVFLPLAWKSQADISDMYQTIITPAWFTFSIWSIIYLSWFILWIYLINKKDNLPKKKSIIILWIAELLSAIWIIPWNYEFLWISFILILSILIMLFYISMKNQKDLVFKNTLNLYLWWILVATIANLHVLLMYYNIYDYKIIIWVISIAIWASINYFLYKKYWYIISSLVFIWALIWIISNQSDNYIIISSVLSILFLFTLVIKEIIKIRKCR